ncbi:hypothetical protein E4T44_00924 [Aureobasidium sp. EXF-8845]|nr:hypothetical protein E4T44_00924 [Aureobasidium sp. EXF-8845]KAI4857138.1 hypothetical protein E4T45_01379 [Aureobasidium sp. EXF-8846]
MAHCLPQEILWTPAIVRGKYGAPDLPCSENRISLPAVLKITTACGTLQRVHLVNNYYNPLTEPEFGRRYCIATANGLAQLPSNIQSLHFCWISPSNFDVPETRSPSSMPNGDPLCVALHKISLQLYHLHIEDMAVFPELFGKGCVAAHWPHLEILRVGCIGVLSPSGGVSRYADGSSSEETLTERYIDDVYTSLGHAAQSMPKLKRVSLELTIIGQELELMFRNNQCTLHVRVDKHYKPSPRFLKAWKVPGGELQPCKGRGWQQAMYMSWPPS